MKSKLHFLLLFVIGYLSYAQNAISSITAPNQVALNTNASVTINYVADVAGTYQFQVFPKNPDNSPNFAAGGTNIYAGGTLPAAPSGGVFTSLPSDLYVNPSTEVLGDYVWFIKMTVGGTDYYPPTNKLVSIVNTISNVPTNGITSATSPSQIAINSHASVTINYVANVAGTYEFQVYPKNPDNTINFSGGGTTIYAGGTLPAAPSGGIFTSNPTDLFVANTIALGDYIWFIKIVLEGTDYVAPTNQLVSVVTSLNVNTYLINSSEMFINYTRKSLELSAVNTTSKSANIYSLTGEKVLSISKLDTKHSIDLARLTSGMYVLVTNDNRILKFVL